MALRNWSSVPYLPILSLRPAEVRALEELPENDKDLLLPLIELRPWGASHHLVNSLARIDDAYGDRPVAIDLCEELDPDNRRPVHDELEQLQEPDDGYDAWCEFIEARPNFIPVVQLRDPAQLPAQIARLWGLDRGLIVRVPIAGMAAVEALARTVAAHTDGGEDVCFVLDYERQTRELLLRQAQAVGLIRTIQGVAGDAVVAPSASSFPDSFVGVRSQDIYERLFFDGIRGEIGGDDLIYSDRGSARAERQGGGGGLPAPRIDYARTNEWQFYRGDSDADRFDEYRRQARLLMASADWDPNLRLWGTQMIERTSLGDANAISSPPKSTAARINIHLHVQLFRDNPAGIHDTDEDWSDL